MADLGIAIGCIVGGCCCLSCLVCIEEDPNMPCNFCYACCTSPDFRGGLLDDAISLIYKCCAFNFSDEEQEKIFSSGEVNPIYDNDVVSNYDCVTYDEGVRFDYEENL